LATCSGICDDLLGLLAGSVEYLLGFTLGVSDRLVCGLLCELEDLGRRVQVFSFAASESWHDLAFLSGRAVVLGAVQLGGEHLQRLPLASGYLRFVPLAGSCWMALARTRAVWGHFTVADREAGCR
jgi:hypothetical protein